MNFFENTGKTIQEAFDKFDKSNPHVYDAIKAKALGAANLNKKRISFLWILNSVLWEQYMKTDDSTEVTLDGEKRSFKINMNYSSRYARKFVKEFPEHENKVEFRRLRADDGDQQKKLPL